MSSQPGQFNSLMIGIMLALATFVVNTLTGFGLIPSTIGTIITFALGTLTAAVVIGLALSLLPGYS